VRGGKKSVAILVDSTISTPYVSLLPRLRPLAQQVGPVKIAKVMLLQHQAIGDAKEISHEGFLPVIVHDDIDVHFALETMELIYNDKIQSLAIVTDNENYLPLFSRARELGKEVILIQTAGNAPNGLQKAADLVLTIGSPSRRL
jgi:uncharacterized protein (TIGR00288 family)